MWQNFYRPKKISDFHLVDIREKLTSFFSIGQCPQVMLFAGPKGTGKTSTARLIAAILNSKDNLDLVDKVFNQKKKVKSVFHDPDLSDDLVLKIFSGNSFLVEEIDAASNRGIDDVRSLKERIFVTPSIGKVKVYILDEVHMFTTEAFNALLKILEEPPQFAVFILATTERYKIPATVVSRCSVFEFHKATNQEIVSSVENILKQEKISYQMEALEIIAFYADGSFRDAIKVAENIATLGEINLANTNQFLDVNVINLAKEILNAVVKKDQGLFLTKIEILRKKNINEVFFLKLLANLLHESLMTNLINGKENPLFNQKISFYLLQILLEIDPNQSLIPFLSLEIVFIKTISKALEKKSKNNSNNLIIKNELVKKIEIKATKMVVEDGADLLQLIKVKEKTDCEKKEKNINDLLLIDDLEILNLEKKEKKKLPCQNKKNLSDFWVQLQNQFQDSFSLRTLFKEAVIIEEKNNSFTLGFVHKLYQERMMLKKNIDCFYQGCKKLNLPIKKIIVLLIKPVEKIFYSQKNKQDKSLLVVENKETDISQYFN